MPTSCRSAKYSSSSAVQREVWPPDAAGACFLAEILTVLGFAAFPTQSSQYGPRSTGTEERLAAYRAAGMDDHSLNIYRFRMERDYRQTEEQPVYIGRRHGRIIIRR